MQSTLKHYGTFACVAATLALTTQLFAAGGDTWLNDLSKAKDKATASGKNIVVKIGADWCGPCKLMQKTTWPDKDVIKNLDNFITVSLDEAKHASIIDNLKIQAYPTVLVLSPDGKEITRSEGYLAAGGMSRFLTTVTKKYPTPNANAKNKPTANAKTTKSSAKPAGAAKPAAEATLKSSDAKSTGTTVADKTDRAKTKTTDLSAKVSSPKTEVKKTPTPRQGLLRRLGGGLKRVVRTGGGDSPNPAISGSLTPLPEGGGDAKPVVLRPNPATRKAADPVKPAYLPPVTTPVPTMLKRVNTTFMGIFKKNRGNGGGADGAPLSVEEMDLCDIACIPYTAPTPKPKTTAKPTAKPTATVKPKAAETKVTGTPKTVEPTPEVVQPRSTPKVTPTPVTVSLDEDERNITPEDKAAAEAAMQPITETKVDEQKPPAVLDVEKTKARYVEAHKAEKDKYPQTARAIYGSIVRDDPQNMSGIADMAFLKFISLTVMRNDKVLRAQAYARICEFDARYPKSPNRDAYTIIRAQLAGDLGKKDEAIQLLCNFPTQFPESKRTALARTEWGKLTNQSMPTPAPNSGTKSETASKTTTKSTESYANKTEPKKTETAKKPTTNANKEKTTAKETSSKPKSAYDTMQQQPQPMYTPAPQVTPRQGLLRRVFNR